MKLYADYLEERTNDFILCHEGYGFATYRYLNDKQVYIVDVFVSKEHRKLHIATQLADEIVLRAKEKGCVELIMTVVPSTKNSTTSLAVVLAYGMLLKSASQDLIIMKKDI